MNVEIKPLCQYDVLDGFLEKLEKDNEFFHPDLTLDLYYGLWFNKQLVAIGFIRGWEGDWPEKVLGVAVLSEFRRFGFGTLLYYKLEIEANKRAVDKLRVHVHPDNKPSLSLFGRLGFVFTGEKRENNELIGRKNLHPR